MENQNLNILDEVNKGATMGMDAISFVSDKAKDNTFKEVLDVEFNKYKDIEISLKINTNDNIINNYENQSEIKENINNFTTLHMQSDINFTKGTMTYFTSV